MSTNSERKARISKLWRKYGFGRLYWRTRNSHWRSWDTDDVAMAKDGAARTHFKTYRAIEERLESYLDEIPF